MLASRRSILARALQALAGPVVIWTQGEPPLDEKQALSDLASLSARFSLLRAPVPAKDDLLQGGRRVAYSLAAAGESGPRNARFIGFPEGQDLDVFVDEAIAISRDSPLASPLARETLQRLERSVRVRIFGVPG